MGAIDKSKKGAIVSSNDGAVTAYALKGLEARGIMFVKPQDKVYNGMVVGEHTRDTDIEVNPTKAKQVTNMRTSGKEEFYRLSPPKIMSIEEAISYVRGMCMCMCMCMFVCVYVFIYVCVYLCIRISILTIPRICR